MKNCAVVAATLAGIVMLSGAPLAAQDRSVQQASAVTLDQTSAEENIRWFRKDVRSLKKQTISANLELSDSEAQQFWPLYDQYTVEMGRIEDKKFELLQDYAKNYGTITDEQADAYINGRAAVEQDILQLRLRYLPMFRKILPGRKTALLSQMEWRLGLVAELQLASQVPMIEP